jgi:hypothetical protein
MLTVWCVFNGDKYQPTDVTLLRSQVERHTGRVFEFKCLADRPIPGVDCVIPWENWPGWWAKLLLFRYGVTGENLYFDLDSVIVGNIDDLVTTGLAMPKNWGQSGFGGCQSSAMAWGGYYNYLPDGFDLKRLQPPERGNCGGYLLDDGRELWGDQEYITEYYGNPGDGIVEEMAGVYSYKYHCQGGPPPDARVISFHGDPKPGAVSDSWVCQSRYT